MKKILFLTFICFIMDKSFSQLEFRNSNVGWLVNLEDFNGIPLKEI